VTVDLNPIIKKNLLAIHDDLSRSGELYSKDTLDGYYSTFRQRFGPEILSQLDGVDLLETMHLHGNKDSLVYWLEFKNDEELPDIFGGIGGGSALKFGIYCSKETGKWMAGHPRKQKVLSQDEAVAIAQKHRDQFIKGCDILNRMPQNPTEKHYEELQKKLEDVAPDISNTAWGHKYFSLIYPDKLDDFHNANYQNYQMIKMLQLPPKLSGRYTCAWKFVEIARNLGIRMNQLTWCLNEQNGRPVRYWRVGTRIGKIFRWNEMREGNFAAVGWPAIGELSHITYNQKSKDLLKRLLAEHYPAIPSQVGRQATQIFNFVTTIKEDDVILVSDGARVLGIGKAVGDYYHVSDSDFPHRRNLEWLSVGEWKMPTPEGLQTTIHEVKKYPHNLIEVERQIIDKKPSRTSIPIRTRVSGIQGRIQKILERKNQVILYGPPGTGKTYWAETTARELAALYNFKKPFDMMTEEEKAVVIKQESKDVGYVNICCFHPEYGYEDFIEGYRPELINGQAHFKLRDGMFKRLCDEASSSPTKRFFLIIDEINRGDIPRIFGELLMIMESNKRGMRLNLPVSGRSFCVPKNVFIIGTMNTADRSIALLDTALRRRFGFIELMPDIRVLEDVVIKGIPLRLWLKSLNERICQHLGRDARNLQVGHSYFMSGGKTVATFQRFVDIIHEDIIPLLGEYCYEDFSILSKILGTKIVDESSMRVREELFTESFQDKLLPALLASCPDIGTTSQAVDSVTEELEQDESEVNDGTNDTENDNP